ncbi:unnamed protein product [Gadus morhua 'NCC']
MGPEKQAPPQIPNGVSGMCSVKGNVLSSVSSPILNPSKAVPGTSLRQSGGKVWILLGVRGHGPEPYYLLETLWGSERSGATAWSPTTSWRHCRGQGSGLKPPGDNLVVMGHGLEPYYLLETLWGSEGSGLKPPGDNVGVWGHGLEPHYLLETLWVSEVRGRGLEHYHLLETLWGSGVGA